MANIYNTNLNSTAENIPFTRYFTNARSRRIPDADRFYYGEVVRPSKVISKDVFTIMMRGAPVNSIEASLQTTASTLSLASSSANDTSAGTGLRTLIIRGVDANFDFLEETITLNGQTPVTTTNSFRGVNELKGLTAGSLNTNEGVISVAPSGEVFSSGKPTTTLYYTIERTWTKSALGIHFIPNNREYYSLDFRTNGQSSSESAVEIKVSIQEKNSLLEIFSYTVYQNQIVNYPEPALPALTGGTIIIVEGRNQSNVGSNQFSVRFSFWVKRTDIQS